MGSFRRRVVAGACTALVASTLVVSGGPAGALPAKRSSDSCSLITNEDLLGMQSPGTLDSTDKLSAKSCLYRLDGSSTIKLFVDKVSDFRMEKALAKKQEKVRGLPSGYSGELPDGDAQVGFKSGANAIRLTSTALEAPDLIVLAKAIEQHLS
jgi:hypothetical protein